MTRILYRVRLNLRSTLASHSDDGVSFVFAAMLSQAYCLVGDGAWLRRRWRDSSAAETLLNRTPCNKECGNVAQHPRGGEASFLLWHSCLLVWIGFPDGQEDSNRGDMMLLPTFCF